MSFLKTFGKIAITIPIIIVLFIVSIVDVLQIDSLFDQEISFIFYPITTIIYFFLIWILSKLALEDGSIDTFDGDSSD